MPRLDILEKESEIRQWISEERPKSYICQQLHCKPETLNTYLKKMNIEYKGQQNKKGQLKNLTNYRPASYYFDNKQQISSHKLKVKLLQEGYKEYKCELCGLSVWQNVQIPLELHHKDGNHFNNNLDNLQILCPNCHAIQDGNAGANIGKYADVLELEDKFLLDGNASEHGGSNPPIGTNRMTKKKVKYCIDCGKEISEKATRCKSCASKFWQTSRCPSRKDLKYDIRNMSFLAVGKKYGVSDNAVRKWCKSLNLPHKATEIKNISDEDWELI